MPAIPIPPWIRPPESGQRFAAGLGIGAEIEMKRQALQAQQLQAAVEAGIRQAQLRQRSAESAMEIQARAEQAQQQMALERQKIELDQAYKDQMIGLAQQRIDAAAEKNALSTQAAATKFAAQEQYRQRVAAGEAPETVMLELAPLMSASAGDFGAALRSSQGPKTAVWIPEDLQSGAPGHFDTPSGVPLIPARTKDEQGMTSALRGQTISYLKSKREQLVKEMPRPPYESMKAKEREAREASRKPYLDQIAEIDARIEDLLKPLSSPSRVGGVQRIRRNPQTGRMERFTE